MRKVLFVLTILVASSFAQRTLFTLPVGNDTFKIKADACLWTRGWYQMTTVDTNPSTTDFTFGRSYGFVGATVQYGKFAYARYYEDLAEINGKPNYDAYAGLTCRGFDFRFGQYKMPLGYEVITAPWRMDFIENSMLISYRTPTTLTRDIGALLTYNQRFVQPCIGVANGNGRNHATDNNPFKDMVFRLAVTPLGNPDLTVAANGYIGNDTAAVKDHPSPYQRFGGEILWSRPTYFARGEYLMGSDSLGQVSTDSVTHLPVRSSRSISGFYVAGGARFGAFQPVLRLERFSLGTTNTTSNYSALAFGVNAFMFKDMVKPMLDVTLSKDDGAKKTTSKVMFQIQAAFW